ncbi:MAG: hypothetical protein DRP01_06695 [Archaeoglobales archaeon]|nr:MAG: hypothetical protein DRP01_06695 [Archaeoglobales archaeon]
MGLRDLIEHLRDFLSGDNLYEMANVGPSKTGLPYGIWISHKGSVRHGPRIKSYPEGYANKKSVVVVSIGADPEVIKKPRRPKIPSASLGKLVEYVKKNQEILLQYWNDDDMDTQDLLSGLKALD